MAGINEKCSSVIRHAVTDCYKDACLAQARITTAYMYLRTWIIGKYMYMCMCYTRNPCMLLARNKEMACNNACGLYTSLCLQIAVHTE